MLSICIPVYNTDGSNLVKILLDQMGQIKEELELIVIDDASDAFQNNFQDFSHPRFKYIPLKSNIGRAKIRNYFREVASQPYLLFIDGDSEITSPFFLDYYVKEIKTLRIDVLCGGSVYQEDRPKRSQYLRWKYSKIRESKPAKIRISKNIGFKTNNFIIRKTIFDQISFNESLEGYGHEDTLFGFEIKKNNILVHHIDNPVLNRILDNNESFLIKTKQGVNNLKKVLELVNYDPEFIAGNRLSNMYFTIKKNKLLVVFKFISWSLHPLNSFLLKKGVFVLPMLDMFKLRCLIEAES